MARKISEERKGAYYLGMVLMILGFILFASVFVTFFMTFGDFSNFPANAKSSMLRAFLGMALIIAGQFIRMIGARGVAGSGVILDPEQAREELEPYSRMAGGMVRDALEAADVNLGGKAEKVVMIKCRACGKLNEEDSRFCQECGEQL